MDTLPIYIDRGGEGEKFEIDLDSLYHPKSKYSVEEKVHAVMSYITTGDMKEVGKLTGIDAGTLHRWKNKSRWWPDLYKKCKDQKQEELDAKFTELVDLAVSGVKDRIINGDSVYDSKTGCTVKVPMKGRELATVMGQMFDKRALIRGDATSRTVQVSTSEHLKQLQESFEKFSKDIQRPTVIEVVERVEDAS